MTYAEIMIQAYAEANGITREEVIERFGLGNLMPINKMSTTDQMYDPRLKELLSDLRNDPKGVHAWAAEATS